MTASRKAQVKQVTKSIKRTHTCDITLSMRTIRQGQIFKKKFARFVYLLEEITTILLA